MDITKSPATDSPNFSSRNGARIEMIVMHATAGTRRSDIPTLTDPHTGDPRLNTPADPRVSIHYYIQKDNKVINMVDESKAAWHAGVSSWLGWNSVQIRNGSIGIEMENLNTGTDPYPQFETAVQLVQELIGRYQVRPEMLVRHLDIAPGRKTDPAGFDWQGFQSAVFSDRWHKWGTAYPLPTAQRGFGIPSAWYRDGGNLGAAISWEISSPLGSTPNSARFVSRLFERGCIWGVEPLESRWTVSYKK